MQSNVYDIKRKQLYELASYRDHLRKQPELRWLFFELTNACNLRCHHCGSSCTSKGNKLTVSDIEKTLKTIPLRTPMICLTGGEPLLHPDFFCVASKIAELNFHWGMTSNATLINKNTATKLCQVRMDTISVSLDGLKSTHDALRRSQGAWAKAVAGIKHLQDAGFSPQVTSVIHKDNIDEMDDLYGFLCGLGINSWRIINIEPIGRACEAGNLLLNSSQIDTLLRFIQNKRYDSSNSMDVTYGCSHYLGIERERMVRNNYFICGAGIFVASIRSNGDICSCLDIENRVDLVQGNISKDNFWNVWRNEFSVYRMDRTLESPTCMNCADRIICGGDSTHTWNWTKKKPMLCMMQQLSENHSGIT